MFFIVEYVFPYIQNNILPRVMTVARKRFFFVLFYVMLTEINLNKSASILSKKRTKRGLLSRSGICPKPTENYVVKDTRLNFYGMSYTLPGEENPPCTENGCTIDEECIGDRKCCLNNCGARVCTEAVRDPHPCEVFHCPVRKVCKIERVRCVEPACPDLLAISRPICVPGGPIYEIGKRFRIPRPNIQAYRQRWNILGHKPEDVQYLPAQPYYQQLNNKSPNTDVFNL